MSATVSEISYQPHKFQREIHLKARRFTVVVAHRRFGKTYLAVMQLIHAALATQKEQARFAYLAPFLKQAKSVAWDYMRQFSRAVPDVKINEGELSIDFPNGSRIRLFGGDNPEALRGLYFDGIVLDELADLRPELWGAVIRPALSDRKGWALFIGTPKGVDQFHELYQYAVSGGDPEWIGMMYRVDETDRIPAEELKSARAVMSDAQYRQEWLCDFTASTDNTLITIDMASAAAAHLRTEAFCQGMPKVVGVDVARFGGDNSCIIKRWGLVALEPIVMQGVDNMQLAGHVAEVIHQWEPDGVFIDAGRGEGVIDRLRSLGFSVVEVNFGGKPNDPHYANKRSEMWDTMAKWLRDGGSIPNDSALKSELCSPTYSFDASGRLKLEPKEDMKERGIRSPDRADALALTFAHPVAARQFSFNVPTFMRSDRLVKTEYDPFGVN